MSNKWSKSILKNCSSYVEVKPHYETLKKKKQDD